jgi:hypothetical protein
MGERPFKEDTAIIVRRWGAGSVEPLTLRENDSGDVDIIPGDDGLIDIEKIVLHRDDAFRVAEWLVDFAERTHSDPFHKDASGNPRR